MDLSPIYQNCLNCKNARCHNACPCGNEIPRILDLLKQGKEKEAADLLYSTNPFPEWTSLLCDHQRQCRGNCIRGIRGEPVDFPAVEHELSIRYPFPFQTADPCGKSVAIVGAGPSALSASVYLSLAGFGVTIYDKQSSLGGAMLTGIPNFRFDKAGLLLTQKRLETLGVKFCFNTEFNSEKIGDLRGKYDEVILAVGAEKENRLVTPPCKDIHTALSLLEDANIHGDYHGLGQKKHIVVMGGGNVAMDVSRLFVRQGVRVTLIYRRDEASMPAQRHEIAEAKEDGVVFSPLTNVADYRISEEGDLLGLRLVRMGLGEKDESGRPSFFTIEGSEFDLDCDAFIMAIGEKSDLASLVDPVTLGGSLHAIGDCSYGAKNIAAAIRSGREKAKEIIEKYR